MTAFLPAVVALLLVFAAGFGVSTRFGRHLDLICLDKLIALAWLFGTLSVSLFLWLAGVFLRGPPLLIAGTVFCLALGLFGARSLASRIGRLRMPRPGNQLEWLLVFLFTVQIAIIFYLSFRHTLGWDGLLVWEMKARYAFLNGGALPKNYFSDPTRMFSHPEYPLFLPMLEMWMYLWIGDCYQFWLKLLFPIFYTAGLVLLMHASAELSGKRSIGLLVANLFLFVPFLTSAPGGIIVGYVDVPLSFFYLAAVYFLLRFNRDKSTLTAVVFVVFAAALPWVKREGAILWLVIACCGAWQIRRRYGLFCAGASFIPGICVITSWQIYLAQMHSSGPRDFFDFRPAVLSANAGRIGPIFRFLGQEMLLQSNWSLLWSATAIATGCILLRRRHSDGLLLLILMGGPIALYSLVYVFSAWPDYLGHVESSLPRLLLHVVPVAMLTIALALAHEEANSPNEIT